MSLGEPIIFREDEVSAGLIVEKVKDAPSQCVNALVQGDDAVLRTTLQSNCGVLIARQKREVLLQDWQHHCR